MHGQGWNRVELKMVKVPFFKEEDVNFCSDAERN